MAERTKPSRTYSLRSHLTRLVAALAIPLLGLQAWWSYYDINNARAQAETHALAFADATSLGVLQFLGLAEQLMTVAAQQIEPRAFASEEMCEDRIGTTLATLPFLANALAVDARGGVVCVATGGPASADVTGWNWWEDFRAGPAFAVGDPVEGTFTGAWILPLVAPSLDPETGAFQGAIVGSVALEELSRFFGGMNLPDSHLITVATAERVVIARSHDAESYVGRSLPTETGSDREVGPGRWVASGPDLAGIRRTWGQTEIGPGWVVYVGVPDEVVYGPARAEAFRHVGATILVVLAGFLLAFRSHRRIATALEELAQRTRATAAGDIVPLPANTPLEVSGVVEQFNETLRGRDRAKAAERRARERFQSIFDNAVFGLYVSTLDGRFLQVNPALVTLLGYESDEALMLAGPGALYADPEQRQTLIRESLATGRVESHELDWLRADGVPVTVRVGGKVITGPDGAPVFEMIVQDITEEKRTEDELRQTQKMEAIGQLAGGIAHDFNNLLTVIGGNVELLEDELPRDAPLRADLNQISRATKRATSLTRRLLTFSRKERRGEQTLDPNDVIPELGKMLVPLIGENMSLITEFGPGPFRIAMDPGELEQVVLNLVLNARDAIPRAGQIVIGTRAAMGPAKGPDWDTIGGIAEVQDGVVLSVKDNGVGMDEPTRRRIFEPFYTTKPMGEGTGLGLSTVYGIVKRASGQISVQSEPGAGTTVEVWFPLAHAPEVEVEAPDETRREDVRGTESILVVEDDELVRHFVQRALTDAGWEVHTRASGDTALELLQSRTARVDLVLTDVVMKGLSGPELAERLATLSPGTPVLFMSGYFDNSFLSSELADHPEALLRKPFTAAELRRRIRRALDRGAVPPSVA